MPAVKLVLQFVSGSNAFETSFPLRSVDYNSNNVYFKGAAAVIGICKPTSNSLHDFNNNKPHENILQRKWDIPCALL